MIASTGDGLRTQHAGTNLGPLRDADGVPKVRHQELSANPVAMPGRACWHQHEQSLPPESPSARSNKTVGARDPASMASRSDALNALALRILRSAPTRKRPCTARAGRGR